MNFYEVKLRLQGSPLNEVIKHVSAAEIHLLAHFHGEDALSLRGKLDSQPGRTDAQERDRLEGLYNEFLMAERPDGRPRTSVNEFFGFGQALPREYARFDNEYLYNDNFTDEELQIAREAVKAARKRTEMGSAPVTDGTVDSSEIVTNQQTAQTVKRPRGRPKKAA